MNAPWTLEELERVLYEMPEDFTGREWAERTGLPVRSVVRLRAEVRAALAADARRVASATWGQP